MARPPYWDHYMQAPRQNRVIVLEELNFLWDESENGGRKSIPYEWFLLNCELVKSKNGILLDYLGVILGEKEKTQA
ncbi:hypothetical protein C0966_00620 [Bacillus methanolicus]|uniref:hypothetical protein n=1 Tax=Bacillus methanolicus TaxID=1471 RepID=UPI002380B66A|nr:hypothetical protein [Bacillus methanolicus]MDE3837911.1 hypothetical protein [Bacillus methanolicus]